MNNRAATTVIEDFSRSNARLAKKLGPKKIPNRAAIPSPLIKKEQAEITRRTLLEFSNIYRSISHAPIEHALVQFVKRDRRVLRKQNM